jgi:hypothetical protein
VSQCDCSPPLEMAAVEPDILTVTREGAVWCRLVNLLDGAAALPPGPHAAEQMLFVTYAEVLQTRRHGSRSSLVRLAAEGTRP